jgi:pyocin large subunit-like protein
MAKTRKRIATHKKASKRRKANAKPARKKAAKRATQKKRTPKAVAKMAPRKTLRQRAPVIEDTIIDVIDEPIPGVVRIAEYETVRTTTPKGGAGPDNRRPFLAAIVLATALVASVADPKAFRSGRSFSAWIGLVPRQNSSGGSDRLGGMSKRGDR